MTAQRPRAAIQGELGSFSHQAARRHFGPDIEVLCCPDFDAAIAAGADGLIVETHPTPERALSDGDQSLTLGDFAGLMQRLQAFAEASGRSLPTASSHPDADSVTLPAPPALEPEVIA